MDIDYHYVCFHCLRCFETICRTLCIIIMIGYPSSFIFNSNYDGRIGTYRLEMLYAAATTDACETLDWTNMLQTRSGKGRIIDNQRGNWNTAWKEMSAWRGRQRYRRSTSEVQKIGNLLSKSRSEHWRENYTEHWLQQSFGAAFFNLKLVNSSHGLYCHTATESESNPSPRQGPLIVRVTYVMPTIF